jgi:hypothetical protein
MEMHESSPLPSIYYTKSYCHHRWKPDKHIQSTGCKETNRDSAKQILICQRVRRINLREDRGNWRVASGNTVRYSVKK